MIELAGRSTEDPEQLSGTLLLPGGVEIGRIRAIPVGDGRSAADERLPAGGGGCPLRRQEKMGRHAAQNTALGRNCREKEALPCPTLL